MRRRTWSLGIVVLAWGMAALPAWPQTVWNPSTGVVRLLEYRHQVGDDPAWSDPHFDDGAWPWLSTEEPLAVGAVQWLRGRVEITGDARLPPGKAFGMRVVMQGSWELYWDGVRLGQSGVVGTDRASEEPGLFDTFLVVPRDLAGPGVHRFALRCSTFHGRDTSYQSFGMLLGEYDALRRTTWARTLQALMPVSAFLLVAVWALISWLADRRDHAALYLGLLALVTTAQALLDAVSRWSMFTGDLLIPRSWTMSGLGWLYGVLLLLFLGSRFDLGRWGRIVTLVYLVVSVARIPWYDYPNALFFWSHRAVLILVLVIAIRGLIQRRWALASLMVPVGYSLVQVFRSEDAFMFLHGFVGTGLLLAQLLILHTLEARRFRREREEARTRSDRLELELVRRHLQPHFVMNTLMALAEWLDTDPATAQRMIEALAEEIRLLGDLSLRQRVTLGEEVDLCRAHLMVMGLRQDHDYVLDLDGIDPAAEIPPAIFHTLLENAITHNCYEDREVRFHLAETRQEGRRTLTFTCPRQESSRSDRTEYGARLDVGGMGLHYVRARLEESYPGAWTLHEAATETEWQTRIEIPS